jgi:CubicO group peptidase (beta-lactamase class C family)
MSDFDKKLEEKVHNAGKPAFHGAVFKGIDKTGTPARYESVHWSMSVADSFAGKLFYSKDVGRKALDPAAEPITGDDFLKLTSSTKVLTSIALLQCVERGLIDLDESVYKVLPELENVGIISWKDEEKKEFQVRKSTKPITPRKLLTHTSGVTVC